MKTEEIKKQMKSYRDVYGGQLLDDNMIDKAKSKKKLVEIIESHRHHLEGQANDAGRSLDRLKERLQLNNYD